MAAIQLEFNIDDKTPEELKFSIMQKQIDEMGESMGKVRRKLFAEMGEVKKLYAKLLLENQGLKEILKEIKNEKTEWVYNEDNSLFSVKSM